MIAIIPVSTYAEVVQNVQTLLATPVLSVPLNRALGVLGQGLDSPLPQAQAAMTYDFAQAIAQWEPRASLQSLSVSVDEETGRVSATVSLMIAGQPASIIV